jgi:hypothetical protein
LTHFVKLLGMTPMEAIISATAYGGEIMLHPEELGKVQPGYFADLLLVNGNPLEDIEILANHKNLDMVMIVSHESCWCHCKCQGLILLLLTQNGRVHKEHPKDHPAVYEANKSLIPEAERLKAEEKKAEANAK